MHADGGRTTVRVEHGKGEITVQESTDGGPGRSAELLGGSGRGLAGLRERVGVLGGEFSAGHQAAGGFVVHARIPVGSPS